MIGLLLSITLFLPPSGPYAVVRVVDGDTIVVAMPDFSGRLRPVRVRLVDRDAPECGRPRPWKPGCWEATLALAREVAVSTVAHGESPIFFSCSRDFPLDEHGHWPYIGFIEREDRAMTTTYRILAQSTKKLDRKPYLALVRPGFDREFAKGKKATGTTKLFVLEVPLGAVVEGRVVEWTGDEYEGGYFLAVATRHGLYTISRETADLVHEMARDGWAAADVWSVDDGRTALDAAGTVLGDNPFPEVGDCGGLVFEREGERRLERERGEGIAHRVARLEGEGFPRADLAPTLPGVRVFDKARDPEMAKGPAE